MKNLKYSFSNIQIGSALRKCSLVLVMVVSLHVTLCAQNVIKINGKSNLLLFILNPKSNPEDGPRKIWREGFHFFFLRGSFNNSTKTCASLYKDENSQNQGSMDAPVGFSRIAMFQVSSFVIFPLTAFHPSSTVWQFHFYNSLNIQWFIITIFHVILLFPFWHQLPVPNNKSTNAYLK